MLNQQQTQQQFQQGQQQQFQQDQSQVQQTQDQNICGGMSGCGGKKGKPKPKK